MSLTPSENSVARRSRDVVHVSNVPMENRHVENVPHALRLLAACTLLLCSCQSLPRADRLANNPDKPHGTSARRKPASSQSVRPAAKPAAASSAEVPAAAANEPIALSSDRQDPEAMDQEMSTDGPDSLAATPENPGPIPHATWSLPNYPRGLTTLPPAAFGPAWTPADDAIYPSPEEYVCNGGDRETAVLVANDWTVRGLHAGDTVIHYDTIDGKTRVEPSNDVCLYAPRFAAVRKVYGIVAHEQHDRAAGVELPVRIAQGGEIDEATTVVQPLQAGRKHSVRTAQQFQERELGQGLDNAQRPATAQDRFLPFEDLTIIRRGTFDNSEKARLAAQLQAAIAWTSNQAPQVIIDNKTAVQIIGTSESQSIYTYELPPGKSRVRIIKIASRQDARSGETVDFTIRFDNVGDRRIGNVTVLDRLHERLELVPGSQSCTLQAEFFTEDEEGSPRVLRWEVSNPLEVGSGGIIRFQCRVR